MNKLLFSIFFTSILLLSCTTKNINQEIIVTPPYIPIEQQAETTRPSNSRTVFYSMNLSEPSLQEAKLIIINKLEGKTYKLSTLAPTASFARDKIHTFNRVNEGDVSGNDLIEVELTRDDRFESYKLAITYIQNSVDRRGRRTSGPNTRQWLFPINQELNFLSDQIANTIVRFSFQSL